MSVEGTNTFYIGGNGGTFVEINPDTSGGRWISFYAGELIDAIQIGNEVYGRQRGTTDSGMLKGRAQLPEDGTFIIKKVYTRNFAEGRSIVTYLEADINGQSVTIGEGGPENSHGKIDQRWEKGPKKVQIAGIQCGSYVDGILFKIVH